MDVQLGGCRRQLSLTLSAVPLHRLSRYFEKPWNRRLHIILSAIRHATSLNFGRPFQASRFGQMLL
jgi:hypothetical protein